MWTFCSKGPLSKLIPIQVIIVSKSQEDWKVSNWFYF